MKAIIVEIKGKHAAILSDDGLVSRIKNKNYSLGQEIVIKNNNNKSKIIKMTASAAAAIMIFVTPAWAYLTPYSYVSVDVNPSFEFYINRFDRVLTVKALNDDGKELSKGINIEGLKNKEIQSAVRNVLNELRNKGYIIKGEEGGVIVATSSKSKEKTDILFEKMQNAVKEEARLHEEENKVIAEIEKPNKAETKNEKEIDPAETIEKNEEVKDNDKSEKSDKENELKDQEKEDKEQEKESENREKEFEKREKEQIKQEEKREKEREKEEKQDSKQDIEKSDVKVIGVSEEEVDEAKKLGITPGKLNLIEKLQEAAIAAGHKNEIDIDDWLDKSVQKINSQTKEYREELKQKEDNKNNNKGSNNSNIKNNNGNENSNKGKSNNAKDRKDKNRN